MIKKDRLANVFPLAWLLVIVLAVGILTLPAQMFRSDPNTWREEARSLVLHGSLAIDPEVVKWGVDKRYEHLFFPRNTQNGKWYSRYGVVNGLINAIPLGAEKLFTGELPPIASPKRVFFLGIFFAVFSMAIAWVLYDITGYYISSHIARAAFVLLAFYTTYLWYYLRCTSSESTQLLFWALSYLFFIRFLRDPVILPERSAKPLYLSWLSLLALCQTKVSCLTLLPIPSILLLWLIMRNGGAGGNQRHLIITLIVLPVALIIAAQAGIQTLKFGHPLLTGYHQSAHVIDQFTNTTDEPPPPHTFLSATQDFIWGWQGSIFIHFPLLFLAAFGLRRFLRDYPQEGFFAFAGLLITYLLVAHAGGAWRGEMAYGPRYFAVFLPLVALPALYPLERMLSKPATTAKRWAVFSCVLAAIFLVIVQMQINRLDYFFRYWIQPSQQKPGTAPENVTNYFNNTNFAKINWDHLRCKGHWEELPYYPDMQAHLDARNREAWKQHLDMEVARGNLYWFSQ